MVQMLLRWRAVGNTAVIQKPQPFAGRNLHNSGLQFSLIAFAGRNNLRCPFEDDLGYGLFFTQCCTTD